MITYENGLIKMRLLSFYVLGVFLTWLDLVRQKKVFSFLVLLVEQCNINHPPKKLTYEFISWASLYRMKSNTGENPSPAERNLLSHLLGNQTMAVGFSETMF